MERDGPLGRNLRPLRACDKTRPPLHSPLHRIRTHFWNKKFRCIQLRQDFFTFVYLDQLIWKDQIAELLLTPISGQRKEEDTISSPLTVHVCDLPKNSGGGAKCIDITYHGREHGMLKCGKSFPNVNDLIIHAKNNHNYCLEHDRFKCIPCKLRE